MTARHSRGSLTRFRAQSHGRAGAAIAQQSEVRGRPVICRFCLHVHCRRGRGVAFALSVRRLIKSGCSLIRNYLAAANAEAKCCLGLFGRASEPHLRPRQRRSGFCQSIQCYRETPFCCSLTAVPPLAIAAAPLPRRCFVGSATSLGKSIE